VGELFERHRLRIVGVRVVGESRGRVDRHADAADGNGRFGQREVVHALDLQLFDLAEGDLLGDPLAGGLLGLDVGEEARADLADVEADRAALGVLRDLHVDVLAEDLIGGVVIHEVGGGDLFAARHVDAASRRDLSEGPVDGEGEQFLVDADVDRRDQLARIVGDPVGKVLERDRFSEITTHDRHAYDAHGFAADFDRVRVQIHLRKLAGELIERVARELDVDDLPRVFGGDSHAGVRRDAVPRVAGLETLKLRP